MFFRQNMIKDTSHIREQNNFVMVEKDIQNDHEETITPVFEKF